LVDATPASGAADCRMTAGPADSAPAAGPGARVPASRILSTAELRVLQARSDRRGAGRLAIHLGLLAVTGTAVALASGWLLLPAMLALGVVQAALFAPAHETMHQTAFASRRANAVVGWLVSCPSLLNAQFYTCFHLAHHRHTQIEGADPELDAPDPTDLRSYMLRVSGFAYWSLRLQVIAACWRGDLSRFRYVSPGAAPRVIRSVRAMSLLMAGGAAGAALLFGWATPLLFWIGPQLLGQPFLRAYLLAEHTGCTRDRNGLTNTRTTLTNAAVRLLMWDMPYHAEHHLFPSIPFHRLADAHAAIRTRLGVVEAGYARWNLALLRRLAAGH
jgi:fatty acid desaturase